jgi:hypothetical protein
MSKWFTIVLNNMLEAKRQGDVIAYYYWKAILDD